MKASDAALRGRPRITDRSGQRRLALSACLLAFPFFVLLPGASLGQSYVEPPCSASATPAFEDRLQGLWYRRFWTGECRDLSILRCKPGRPYWNDAVRALTARAPAERRSDVAARACRLGRQIGLEWTRPTAKRRIDTQDLKRLNAVLESASDVEAGLAAVEARVRTKIMP